MTKGIARRGIGSRSGIGRKPIASAYGYTTAQTPYFYGSGTHTFTTPKSGYWKFVLWGAGGGGSSAGPGGSGGYVEVTKYLLGNSTVALTVSYPLYASGGSGTITSTTATFPDGTVCTATRGGVNVAGTASGGDVNLNGSVNTAGLGTNGGAANNGSGAPANLPFIGGAGGVSSVGPADTNNGRAPGGGGAAMSGADLCAGGAGQIVALFLRE